LLAPLQTASLHGSSVVTGPGSVVVVAGIVVVTIGGCVVAGSVGAEIDLALTL